MDKDLYEILGVAPHAEAAEIRERFRRMAKQFHPDVNVSNADRFREINEAYAVLMSPEHRQAYDHQRAAGIGGDSSSLGDEVFAPKPEPISPNRSAWFGGDDASKPGPETPSTADWPTKESESETASVAYGDLQTDVLVTLNEVLNGTTRVINLRRMGTADSPRQLSIEIPRGVRDGHVIRLPGKGRNSLSRGTTGDLFVVVGYAAHPHFHAQESDLLYSLSLQAWQFVLGDTVQIPTLEEPMSLRILPGSQPGQQVRVPNRGLPMSDERLGDLIVRFGIAFPSKLSPESKRAWEQVKSASQFDELQ